MLFFLTLLPDGDGTLPLRTASDYNNLIELLKLNLIRVEKLNTRIAELLALEEKCLAESRQAASRSSLPPHASVHDTSNTASQTHNGMHYALFEWL